MFCLSRRDIIALSDTGDVSNCFDGNPATPKATGKGDYLCKNIRKVGPIFPLQKTGDFSDGALALVNLSMSRSLYV